MSLSLGVLAIAFVVVLSVELPDKTLVATLVLSTRYRPLPVLIGVSAAFFVQCLIAATAGHLLSLLPHRVSVFLGSFGALVTVAAIAVVLGRVVLRVVPLVWIEAVAAVLFAALAMLAAVEAVRA